MKKRLIGLLAAVAMLATVFAGTALAEEYSMYNPPIVETQKGALAGIYEDGTYAFLGVPYATTPERFALPAEVEPWEGVKYAQAFGPVAPIPKQTSVGADELVWPHRYWIQNEACQNLNVWTQSLDPAAKKPVLVFFHGGGFNNGSSIEGAAYDGANLSAFGDVVVVTVNHRLNSLGFLDLSAYGDEYKYTKVNGIADLVASLQWVHDNIEAFGGDPGNVTIFGQSGGGRKVQSILHVPSAEGLVQHVIIMSSQDSTGVPSEGTQWVAAKTMEILGVDTPDALKEVPVDELIAAAASALSQSRGELGYSVNWGLNYDEDYMISGYCDWAADVDIMVGYCFSENSYPSYRFGDFRKNEWNEEELQYWLKERYGDNADAAVAEFEKVFPERPIQDAAFFDGSKLITAAKILQERIESGATAPVYNYIFCYEAPVNGGTTAFHCVDLIYLFHNVELPIVTRATGGSGNADALAVQDTFATAILNFARTGDPSQDGLAWAPYTLEEKNVMVVDVNSECRVLGGEALAEIATQ